MDIWVIAISVQRGQSGSVRRCLWHLESCDARKRWDESERKSIENNKGCVSSTESIGKLWRYSALERAFEKISKPGGRVVDHNDGNTNMKHAFIGVKDLINVYSFTCRKQQCLLQCGWIHLWNSTAEGRCSSCPSSLSEIWNINDDIYHAIQHNWVWIVCICLSDRGSPLVAALIPFRCQWRHHPNYWPSFPCGGAMELNGTVTLFEPRVQSGNPGWIHPILSNTINRNRMEEDSVDSNTGGGRGSSDWSIRQRKESWLWIWPSVDVVLLDGNNEEILLMGEEAFGVFALNAMLIRQIHTSFSFLFLIMQP